MVNPLTAIAKGAQTTVTGAVKTAGETYMANMPNPTKAFYNIGLGIGPMIRNVVSEMKKQSNDGDKEKEKRSKENNDTAKKARVETNKAMAKLQSQLAVSNALLKEIRNLQIKQITAAGKQSTIGTMAGRRMVADSDRRIAAAEAGAMSSALARDKEDTSTSSDIGAFAKLALGGLAVGTIWKNLPNEVRDAMKDTAKDVAGALNESLIQPAFEMWKESFKNDPLPTLAGTLAVAWITGILGAMTTAITGAIKVWRGAHSLGKAAVDIIKPSAVTGQPAASASTAATASTIAAMSGKERTVNGVPLSKAHADYQASLNNPDPAVRHRATKDLAAKYGAENVDLIKGAGGAAETAGAVAAPAATAGGKLLSAAKTGLKWGGRALAVSGIGLSALSAKENFEAGNTWLGTLDTISAASGTAALGLAAGGFLPGAAIAGGISALTGIASGIGGMFVDNNKPATVGPTPAATSSAGPKNLLSNSDFDYQKYLTLVGQQESTNNYGVDNRVGFLGRYQFGSQALEELGLLKKGSSSKYGYKGSNAAVYHPDAWAEGLSLQKFLADPALQDQVMQKYTDAHYKALERAGVIKKGMQDQDIARALYTAHTGGVGGALKLYQQGQDTADFAIAGAGTRFADTKMAAMWSGNPDISPITNNPSALSSTMLASAGSTTGFDIATSQDMYSKMGRELFGSTFNIDMSKIINNAIADAGGGGKGGGLSVYNPGNPILSMAFDAVGAKG